MFSSGAMSGKTICSQMGPSADRPNIFKLDHQWTDKMFSNVKIRIQFLSKLYIYIYIKER
jgi:hypothetical protein